MNMTNVFAAQENPVFAAKPHFPESIKIGEKTPFSVKVNNNVGTFVSEIAPVIDVSPKSTSSFIHVQASPSLTVLPDGFSDIVHGTILADRGIPVDRIFVSVSFIAKNSRGEQVPLINPENSASIKIEKESANADTKSMFDLEKPSCTNPNPKIPLYGCGNTVTVKIDSPLKQFKSGIPINKIQCNKDNYAILLKPNGDFGGCFSSKSAIKQYSRGWPSPNDSHGYFQKSSSLVKIIKGASSPEQMQNYTPQNILVVIGINNTITWVNEDDVTSSVTSNKENLFDSGPIKPNNTWTHTFEKNGLYAYHSEPHPWMKGAVIVIPQNLEFLYRQEKQDIVWYLLQQYWSNPITALGFDPDGTMLIGIHEDELKKNPNAESYYKKKFQQMIPFYVPIRIEFGHAEPTRK